MATDRIARAAEVDVFAALANPVRRDILVRLREGPLAVTELARGFEIGRPAVSEHLQVLRKARLVREEPRGRERYYHLDPRPLTDVETWLDAFGKYWKKRMTALEAVLAERNRR
ncbi:MAG TPA: metalloregulator ArsR/SmtB family transcription factor [Kofleriaceae bacterium]|nr:metalloregulator ArsR/SmtB family transcription factor [Kofleriaceae bacterium]